jgi:hypothetical protein
VFEFRALILIVPFTEYGWLFDIEVYLIFEYSMTTMHPFVISPVSVSFLLLQVLFGCYMNACIGIDISAELLQKSGLLLVRDSS